MLFGRVFGVIFCIVLLLDWMGCKQREVSKIPPDLKRASSDEVNTLIEQFILAEDGEVISIPEGVYELSTQLIIDNVSNLKIKGAGKDKTILSFKNLKSGGEGIKLVGDTISIEGLSVYDAPGDGIRAQHCRGIAMRRLNVTWTNKNKKKNGVYALYPIQCTDVVVDDCEASHSRDAGIYVGQSENIIVMNCYAHGNVAGIEIENSDNAEVLGCLVENNSGGILVFNLPGLPRADGRGCKIYDNKVLSNNHGNFATPIHEGPNGNTVTKIPPGSGIVVLAGKDIEVFNNQIKGNKTVGVAVANYQIVGYPFKTDNGFSPYSQNVYIHNNEYVRPRAMPDISKELGKLIAFKNAHGIGKTQDLLYDGIWDPNKGNDIRDNPMNICFDEEEMNDLNFTLFELSEEPSKIKSFKDATSFMKCGLKIKTDVEFLRNDNQIK